MIHCAKEVMFMLPFICLYVSMIVVSRITQKVMDGFSRNFLERLALGMETMDYILGAIWIWIRFQEFERVHYHCMVGLGGLLAG